MYRPGRRVFWEAVRLTRCLWVNPIGNSFFLELPSRPGRQPLAWDQSIPIHGRYLLRKLRSANPRAQQIVPSRIDDDGADARSIRRPRPGVTMRLEVLPMPRASMMMDGRVMPTDAIVQNPLP